MKTILSTLAAVMIASASFAGAALAEGDYYQGASKAQSAIQTSGSIDGFKAGSIEQAGRSDRSDAQPIFPHTSRDNR